jgi:diaminopimelate decarboxylase
MQIPKITHINAEQNTPEVDPQKWTLCGSLCTTADVLARNVELAALNVGDILVFERTGAYSVMEGMAVFLSREMPEIYVCSEALGLQKIRRMIFTDVFNTPMALT